MRILKCVFCLFPLFLLSVLFAGEPADTASVLLKKSSNNTLAIQSGEWLYSKNEMEHLSKGELTGKKVAAVSACKRSKNADPVEGLKHFQQQLDKLKIKLIIVPVPPKAAVYPVGNMKKGDAMNYLRPYYQELRKAGLNVLDISEVFLKDSKQSYCKTDAHWSPEGIQMAVDAVAAAIPLRGKDKLTLSAKNIRISGDLAKSLSSGNPMQEILKINFVSGKAIDSSSPVLVLGDSHTLVFSVGGDMLAENAGFCELLAAKLQLPVDRIGVRGSAATAVRVDLYRKATHNKPWLLNKKYIIYLFSCREFTEAMSGWSKVPVIKR